jgi:hypothetical protein
MITNETNCNAVEAGASNGFRRVVSHLVVSGESWNWECRTSSRHRLSFTTLVSYLKQTIPSVDHFCGDHKSPKLFQIINFHHQPMVQLRKGRTLPENPDLLNDFSSTIPMMVFGT